MVQKVIQLPGNVLITFTTPLSEEVIDLNQKA